MARRGARGITEQLARQLEARQARGLTDAQQRAARKSAPKPKSTAPDRNAEFELALRARGIGGWVREYRFHPTRGWLLDFAWVQERFAIEIDGGVFSGGRHVQPAGIRSDYDKHEALHLMGWRLYRIHPDMFRRRNTPFEVIAMYVDTERPMPARQGQLL